MIVPTDTYLWRGNISLKNYTIAKLGNVFFKLINLFLLQKGAQAKFWKKTNTKNISSKPKET